MSVGPSRREFLATAGTAALSSIGGRGDAAERPNIVLVLADDLGYHDLACYGQRRIRTPHLDRLAAEGMRFTDHYSGSPVCAPSRCTLLTGLHSGHAYIRDNDEMPELGDVWNDPTIEGQRPLLPQTVTIGTVLARAGYRTAAIGKWGLGGPGSSGEPNRQGFDQSFGYLCQRQAHNYYPDHLWRNGERVALDNAPFSPRQKLPSDKDPNDAASYRSYQSRQYAFDLMLDEADQFIRQHRQRPFFLYFTPTIPHLALQVPDDSLAEYAGAFPETPYLGDKGYLPHRTPRAAYAAMVSRLDRGIGRLVATLTALGIERRTLVLFTSDNGATFDVGGYDPAFFDSNAPWRGAKQQLYEGGIRVPLIAWWPGRVRPGRVTGHPSANWDWLATCAELAGASPGAPTDGISLVPLLTGSRQQAHEHLYWEFQGRQAVRWDRWKALREVRTDALELYDLAIDPSERRDLAADRPAEAARARGILRAARVESVRYPLVPPAR